MASNLDRYKKDLDKLIKEGENLRLSLIKSFSSKDLLDSLPNEDPLKSEALPPFFKDYQGWYTESLILLRQLLPERIDHFISYYEKQKTDGNTIHNGHVISDALLGKFPKKLNNFIVSDATIALTKSFFPNKKYDEFSTIKKPFIPDETATIPLFDQQLNILKAAARRFESSLFDIKQLLQADLFDSELGAAEELNKKGFTRAAGAVSGVVLERHLRDICIKRGIKVSKKNPTIGELSETLKNNNVIETPQWRKIQCLADVRNNCDHAKDIEPTKDEIEKLIKGVSSVIKNVF